MMLKTKLRKMFLIIAILLLFEVGNCQRTLNNLGSFGRWKRADENYTKYERMRINKGSQVNLNQEPFIVYVGKKAEGGSNNSNVLCSGILVDNSSVLTTATCSQLFDKEQLQIGLRSINNGSLLLNVSQIRLHPKHQSSEYNVALLNLDKPVNTNEVLEFASLSKKTDIPGSKMEDLMKKNAKCKSMGYGISSLHPNDAGILRSYNMSLLHLDECILHNSSLVNSTSHVCALLEEADGNCFYEDGAPLICENRVYALFTSFSKPSGECATKPNVFIRMDSIENFLTTESLTLDGKHLYTRETNSSFVEEKQISSDTTSEEKSLTVTTKENISSTVTENIELLFVTKPTSTILKGITSTDELKSRIRDPESQQKFDTKLRMDNDTEMLLDGKHLYSRETNSSFVEEKQISNDTTSEEKSLTVTTKENISSTVTENIELLFVTKPTSTILKGITSTDELKSRIRDSESQQKFDMKLRMDNDTEMLFQDKNITEQKTLIKKKKELMSGANVKFQKSGDDGDDNVEFKKSGGGDDECAKGHASSLLFPPPSLSTLSIYSLILCLLGRCVPGRSSLIENQID